MTSAIGHNGDPDAEERAGNWFAVSRDIFDHPIVGIHGRPFTDTEAWLWLIASASYETRRAMNKGTIIILDPGDLMAAHGFLAKRWTWTVPKVRWYLTRLQNEAMITRHCNKQDTRRNSNQIQIITLCNYSRFQIIKEAQQQAKQQPTQQANSKPTASQQQEYNKYNQSTIQPENKKGDPAPALSGRAFWAQAMAAPVEPAHESVTFKDGRLALQNGFKSHWLEKFGGDEERLDLALTTAANYIQPYGNRSLEVQVSAQLARQVADKRDKDTRYQAAAKNAKPAQSTKPSRWQR